MKLNCFLITIIISISHTLCWDDYETPDRHELAVHREPKNGANSYEGQLDRLEQAVLHRDKYIVKLERHIKRLQRYVHQMKTSQTRHGNQHDNGDDLDDDIIPERPVANYGVGQALYPHDSNLQMSNDDMMDSVIPKINARVNAKDYKCMKSCNYLKNAKQSKDNLSQYMYLMVCAEGCKKTIPCINEKYCLPVMQENPDYFVQCVNGCELFKIAPKVFKSAKC